jgi:prophage regulatory protein
MQRFIRLSEVIGRIGLSRSSIYLAMSKDEFPLPILLSNHDKARAVGWLEVDIENWMQKRIEERKRRNAS